MGTSPPGASFAALNQVPTDLRAKAVAVQGGTGYAVRPDGTLGTWGDAPSVPLPATGLTNLVDVSTALTHALVLHADGTVTTWGAALPGLLDVPDFGGKKVTKIAAGFGYSGVVLEDGSIKIWGFAPFIPAGEPTFDGLTPATKVVSLGLSSTSATVAAVTADGAVHPWGANPAVNSVPASLTGKPVSAVAVGPNHAAVVVTAFRDLTKPTISGTPTVGQTLTATPATFSLVPDAPATGQWYAGNDPIAGKTSTTLIVDATQVGKPISYRTTATRDGDTVTSASAPVGPVTSASAPVGPVTKASSKVSGKAKVSGKTTKVAKKVTLTITVTSAQGISPAGQVTVTLKGATKKKVTATVGANGKATATLRNVKRGKYTAKVTYAGNSNVSGSSGKVKFKF